MRIAAAVLLALTFAPAAWAHGGSGGDLEAKVTSIDGGRGIRAATTDAGLFTLTAPAGSTVVVRDEAGEPFVRFAGGTVFTNTAEPGAAPEWTRVRGGRTYSWHDHRAHADDHHAGEQWTIGGTIDGHPFAVHGVIAETAGGSHWQWLSYVAIGGFVLYLAYVLVTRRMRRVTSTA